MYHLQENVAPYLQNIGERHVKFASRGFKPHYWDIFQVVLAQKLSVASLVKHFVSGRNGKGIGEAHRVR